MSRLASLSTPSRSRSGLSPSPAPSPTQSNASGTTETTHHRMLKLVLAEIKAVNRTWDDLVGVDGLKAGKGIIDASTTMDNLLTSAPDERPPLAGYLSTLAEHRAALQGVLGKLVKTLNKLSVLIDQAEKIYFDAYRLQGAQWVDEEPLWLTWTLRHFVDSLPPLVTLHNHHLTTLTSLSTIILAPGTSFDLAKLTLERWRDLSMGGDRWESVREWEDLVELEMTFGGAEAAEEEVATPGGKGKKKGKR